MDKIAPPPGALVSAAEALPHVPQTISKLQAVLTMAAAPGSAPGKSLLDDVDTIVANSDQATQLAWKYSTELYRRSALVNGLAGTLGMTPEALDGLFVSGSTVLV